MTDITAGRVQRVSKVIVHPLTVRITHWLNALAMIIMIMSGWRIYNSDPILPFYFPVELTLGGSYDGSVDIHNEDGLAGALQWHFAGMWLLDDQRHRLSRLWNSLRAFPARVLAGRAERRPARRHRGAASFSCRTSSASTTPCRRRSISACWPPA